MTTVAWLVPDLIDGSGGHRTILQNAHYLQQRGFTIRIHLEHAPRAQAGETPAQVIQRMFGYALEQVSVGWVNLPPCDILVATAWHSARFVDHAPGARHKAYFVQDLESQFAPAGYYQLMAENSYKFGLVPITIGNWLGHELQDRYQSGSFNFDFCADLGVYRDLPDAPREDAICFIHQPEKPRRAAALGLEALHLVKMKRPSLRIITYGSDAKPAAAFPIEHLGLLGLEQCNQLYNRCALGLCLSSTNPSRIPFEMMAAGLPVVELHRPNTLFDLPESASLLCDQTAEALAAGILHLMDHPEKREQMSRAGREFMQQRDMLLGLQQVERAIRWIDQSAPGTHPEPFARKPLYTSPAFIARDADKLSPAPLSQRPRGKLRRWFHDHLGASSTLGQQARRWFSAGPRS